PVKPATEKPSDTVNVSTTDSLSVSDSDSLGTLIITIECENEDFNIDSLSISRLFGSDIDNWLFHEELNFENNTAEVKVPPGNYKIQTNCTIINPNAVTMLIRFSNDVTVKLHQTINSRFIVPVELPLKVVVRSGGNKGMIRIKKAEVSTDPETVTAITDEEGRADFGTFSLKNYSINLIYRIKKYDLDFFQARDSFYGVTIINGEYAEEAIELDGKYLQHPVVEIISPDNMHYENMYDIHLLGDGYDFEDDMLPESSLVWHSSIDSELGSGRDLTVSNLSEGNHIITLVGTDSHNYTDQDSISLEISYYNDESYYPVPYTGYWYYEYDNTDFTITDIDGEDEHWTLLSLEANADEGYTRTSVLDYAVTRGDSSKYCRYEVSDRYETDDGNIYIAKTTECLRVYDNQAMDTEPLENLDIETVYSPRYLLIQNYMNPATASSYTASGTAESTLNYRNSKSDSYWHTETKNISTSYQFGESETVDTGLGTYEANPLTIRSDGAERIWWLAKGIGIIKLSYDSFGFPLTATMTDTNVPSFSEGGPTVVMWKPAVHVNDTRIELNSMNGTPERMVELSKILRGLCPR
ncbi:hypothetical protein ACFL6P_04095, partial [Candidatus Latescibacterota bacterium]